MNLPHKVEKRERAAFDLKTWGIPMTALRSPARRHAFRTALFLGCCLSLTAPAVAQDEAADEEEGEIVVLGSRIPRVLTEGPAPVTTITDDDFLKNGYQSVPDVLRAITQNGGETQSQQSYSGADFTPGAQQVDLRGLGPNHTLVLVNGRRIADFPLPSRRLQQLHRHLQHPGRADRAGRSARAAAPRPSMAPTRSRAWSISSSSPSPTARASITALG